jgi:hypothetical protein
MARHRGSKLEDYIKFGTPEECWLWRGSLDDDGYPHAIQGRKHVRVHVYMYEKHVGPIPPGHILHHNCEVKRCVNYHHTEPKTAKKHSEAHSPTHCIHGHEFTSENTYEYTKPNGTKYRQCRACTLKRGNSEGKIRQAIARMS